LLEIVGDEPLGLVAEICCGRGEALDLFQDKVDSALGVDISINMLAAARSKFISPNFLFVQGDATSLPVIENCIDTVIMFGGIHHVKDRSRLFSEIYRVMRPGGRFIWREPVSDFFIWRWIRAIIYRVSSHLEPETERPLLYSETVPILEKIGFEMDVWQTCGFLGFCIFMNSDVLVFNRLFRFIPGIRKITQIMTEFDDWVTRQRSFRNMGLQVIGVARKL